MTAVAKISAARKAAFDILLAVERGNAHSDDLLRSSQVSALAPSDRNLTTALVLGVLRRQVLLDRLFRPLLKRPNARLDAEVLIALRMGAFQLRFLDRIPDHAAIDESVELTTQSGHRFAAGMVNAVLRGLTRAAPPIPASEETPAELALSQAHPAWIVERWARFYGLDAARAICRHGQNQPPLSIRIEAAGVQSESTETEIREAGIQLNPGELLSNARNVIAGDVTATPAFLEGRVRIQDEGSQLIGELAASMTNTLNQNVKSILDTCAAPGGKTLILAERNSQARIVACDSSPQRRAQMQTRLAALAGRVECRLADATALQEDSIFDFALADVPCSGTGTLGRNPEVRHRLQLEDLPRHAERQRAILLAALRAVRPGGQVLYSTCSLEPEENELIVAAVLSDNRHAQQLSLAPRIEALERADILTSRGAERLQKCLTPDGALRLLPGVLPTDGFFAALIERKE